MIRLDRHVAMSSDKNSSDGDKPGSKTEGPGGRRHAGGPADFETRARAVLAQRPDLQYPEQGQDERGSIEDVPIEELIAELQRRQFKLVDLRSQRELLVKRLGALDEEIRALGGEVEALPSRGSNALSLADALAGAIEAGVVVSPNEAADAVREAGYRTTAKRFVATVTNTLSKDERFARVGRGRYERLAIEGPTPPGDTEPPAGGTPDDVESPEGD